MSTTLTRAKRPTALGAVLALFATLFVFTSPAQAATLVNVSASETTIVLGGSVTLDWTSTEASLLTAGGDWTGSKATPNGTEVVTPTAVGTKTFTLAADDLDGEPGPSDSVTVEVTAPADAGVRPLPVTFPGDCTVIVPETEGVIYSVTVDGDTEEIEAGEYDGFDFSGDDGDPAVFTAEAADGFTIAEGATVTWTYDADADADCEFDEGVVVTTKVSCSAVTFTNITNSTVVVLYGSFDADVADGFESIPAGASVKVKTGRSSFDFSAFGGTVFQDGENIAVPQNCGGDTGEKGSGVKWRDSHPTNAPAAGVTGDDNSPALPGLALLSGLALVALRRSDLLGR